MFDLIRQMQLLEESEVVCLSQRYSSPVTASQSSGNVHVASELLLHDVVDSSSNLAGGSTLSARTPPSAVKPVSLRTIEASNFADKLMKRPLTKTLLTLPETADQQVAAPIYLKPRVVASIQQLQKFLGLSFTYSLYPMNFLFCLFVCVYIRPDDSFIGKRFLGLSDLLKLHQIYVKSISTNVSTLDFVRTASSFVKFYAEQTAHLEQPECFLSGICHLPQKMQIALDDAKKPGSASSLSCYSFLLADLSTQKAIPIFVDCTASQLVLEEGTLLFISNPTKSPSFIMPSKSKSSTMFPFAVMVPSSSIQIHGKVPEYGLCKATDCIRAINISKESKCQLHLLSFMESRHSKRPELAFEYSATRPSSIDDAAEDLSSPKIESLRFLYHGSFLLAMDGKIQKIFKDSLDFQVPKKSKMSTGFKDQKDLARKQRDYAQLVNGKIFEPVVPLALQNSTDPTFLFLSKYRPSRPSRHLFHVLLEPAALHPATVPQSAVKKIGFDPSAHRKREYSKFIKSLPTPSLGRGLSSPDSSKDSIIDLEFDISG